MKKNILLAALAMASLTAGAVVPMWVNDVRLSPDGRTLAFVYKGALYTVPSQGGHATRLTSGAAYDSAPVWSPDGKKIAFSSDRNGGSDIYVMNSDGSDQKRLTFNSAAETPEVFSADGANVIFSASIQDPASSALGTGRSNSELYEVPAEGGRIRQLIATPAVNVERVPGTDMLIFEDRKGFEDQWRKHHTSSITRDIWTWAESTGKFTNLTARPGEDRDPNVSADGKTVYFLSERNGGSMNVYAMPLAGGEARKLTDYTRHPVRYLSSGGNLLAYVYDGEIYTLVPGQTPRKVAVEVADPGKDSSEEIKFSRADESAVSPDGSQVAFTKRGEVFVTSVKYPSTKQITHTPAIEADLSWGSDGRTLYYTSRRDGAPAIFRAKIVRKEDPNFSNATLIEEEPLFPADGVERSNPIISPDGKKMAYTEDRNILMVIDLASGQTRRIGEGPLTNYRSGSISAEWSPDSRWLALDWCNPLHEPYDDVAIADTDTGEIIKLTQTGYFDEHPRWSPDGKSIIFASERYGMRNHASWGSMSDVMMAFLTQDAYDRFRLSEEDYALLKEVEKEQKKADEKKTADDSKSKKGKKGSKEADSGNADAKEANATSVDREGLQDRIVRLTPNSSDLGDYLLSSDGETLWYLSAVEGDYDLWKLDLRKGDVSKVRKLGASGGSLQKDKDGNMYLAGPTVSKIDSKGSEVTPVGISGTVIIDRAREREAMLDYVEREARERFLLPEMPVDWTSYVSDYRKFLPHVDNNYDFARLLSELLGELNVSHSGGRYSGTAAKAPTASLGLLYDINGGGPGLTVTEVIEGGPFDRASSKVRPGDVVTAVNGEPLAAGEDWSSKLNRLAKKKTLISFRNPATGAEWDEVVLPITTGAENALLYKRWVKGREHLVDSLSGGRLGYVHIQSMDDASFRKVYSKLLGEYVGKDGIVIDTRWNGGGRLHEDIEVLFSGEKYLTQEVHGRQSAEMPSRRWNKPSIMVIGEANYSNAHGTPWVYKHKNLGKLVGMPVPGTMSSVNWITLQDPEVVFGIPVIAFRTAEGNILENTQLEPDIKVANEPQDVVRGIDAQIEAAVAELLREIDAK